MNDPARSFCPRCQANWDRPWYDICPACGHRFKVRPWWQSPWLILGLICMPAIAILTMGLFPKEFLRQIWPGGREDLLIALALLGSTFAALPAAILLACRVKPATGARVLLSLVLVPVIYAVSFGLCFFACAGVLRN